MKKVIQLKKKQIARKKKSPVTKRSTFYLTTAIPYVNAEPHIGHALEFIQTDCIRRYRQLRGDETFLTTGADENSLKNVQAAEERGIAPAQLCAENAEKFKQLALALNMPFDAFLRSSLPEQHFAGSQLLWQLCIKDIYKKKYKGLYCVGCETFYTESELTDGKCPEHDKRPEPVEEENYFFRLSKYQKQLEQLVRSGTLKIYPESRKNEVLSFMRSGLVDFSVSRTKGRARGWGVPVPGDDSQIMYVWFDALNIYQTAIGFGNNEKEYKKWWPCDCHVIGKGILRFHAVYWPAILLAAGLLLPKSIFVHGYVTVDGRKMSKSLGNVVDPRALVAQYGADRLRYFLLRLPAFDDGDFSERALVERANNELVANFSNLFYRVTSFIETHFSGTVPGGTPGSEEASVQRWFREKVEKDFTGAMNDYKLNEALGHVMDLCSELNRYFQSKKPWEQPAPEALYVSANLLKDICILLYPFLPTTATKACAALNCTPDIRTVGTLSLKEWHPVRAEKLFEKTELKAVAEKEKPDPEKDSIVLVDNVLPFSEFKKLDLRIGTIASVKEHQNADKLYILQVDLGAENRQLVAALKGIYTKDELRGKQVIVVCNLEPKDMRGVRSEGMLLAADDGTLLSPIKSVTNGSAVR